MLDLVAIPRLLRSVHGPLALLAHEVRALLGRAFRARLEVSTFHSVKLTAPIHPRARSQLTTFGVHATVSPALTGSRRIL